MKTAKRLLAILTAMLILGGISAIGAGAFDLPQPIIHSGTGQNCTCHLLCDYCKNAKCGGRGCGGGIIIRDNLLAANKLELAEALLPPATVLTCERCGFKGENHVCPLLGPIVRDKNVELQIVTDKAVAMR